MIRTLTFALLLAACGGKGKATPTTPAGHGPEHGEHGDHPDGDEHGMTIEMSRFHDVLQPRWHQAAGPERQKATCDAIKELEVTANEVATATPPQTTNADTWTAATRALVAAVGELESACKSGTGFDAAFTKVHDAFHALMQQGEHGTGGGGTNGGGKEGGEGPAQGPSSGEQNPTAPQGKPAAEPHEHHHGDAA